MASGGARRRSGPPPDPNSFRSQRSGTDWMDLPAQGRAGRAPRWPLFEKSRRENGLWLRLWRKPQAILWERDGLTDQVAMYVRTFCEAAEPGAPASLRTLVRQQEGELLLNLPSLLAARMRIVADDTPPAAATTGGDVPRRSTRDRLTVVSNAAGG
jgi:hypothetical protein